MRTDDIGPRKSEQTEDQTNRIGTGEIRTDKIRMQRTRHDKSRTQEPDEIKAWPIKPGKIRAHEQTEREHCKDRQKRERTGDVASNLIQSAELPDLGHGFGSLVLGALGIVLGGVPVVPVIWTAFMLSAVCK
jgi:hypothetical protein